MGEGFQNSKIKYGEQCKDSGENSVQLRLKQSQDITSNAEGR